MSKDMLGPFLRALGQVPDRHLGLVLDILHKISGERGELIRERLSEALKTPEVVVPAQTNVHIEHVPAEYRQFFEALPAKDRAWILANPRTAIPLFVKAVSTAHIESLPLIFVTQTLVSSQEEFRVADKFQAGKTIDGVRISTIRGYSSDVSAVLQLVEPATPETILRFHTSNTQTRVARVLAGFYDSATITMGQLWELLKRSEDEELLGFVRKSNYACVRGDDHTLYYVLLRYESGGGWDIWISSSSSRAGIPAKRDLFVTR